MAAEVESVRCVREVSVFPSCQRSRTIDFSVGVQPASKIVDVDALKCNIGGGLPFKSNPQSFSLTNNRFIYWRISDNVLELSEESLNVDLSGNCLKIRFLDGTLVPNLSIFETASTVCILVATTNSVHRLVFPHPNLERPVFGGSSFKHKIQSIFSTASLTELQQPWNFATFSQCCKVSSAWVCQDGHTLFALATEIGSILLVKLPPTGINEEAELFELQQSSVMQRLWSGLVPSSLRGDSPLPEAIVDLKIHPVGNQMCIFTLCRDYKLRIWSCQKQECISVKDMLEDVPDDVDITTGSAQNHHKIRLTHKAKTNKVYIGIFLSFQYQNQFCVYEASSDNQDVFVSSVSNMYSPPGNLIDFAITPCDIWAQWTTNDGHSATYVSKFDKVNTETSWSKVFSESSNFSVVLPPYKEPKEVYLYELFYPGRFLDQSIIKAIQIYQHHIPSGLVTDNRNELRKQVIHLIDTEIQLSASHSELNYGEYHDLQLSCWEKFFCCVVQYQQAASQAIGFCVDAVSKLVVIVKMDMLSIVKDCQGSEKLYLLAPLQEHDLFQDDYVASKSLKKGVISIYNTIKLVSEQISNENKADIANDLKYGCSPAEMANHIADAIVSSHSDQSPDAKSELMLEIESGLQKVQNLVECFDIIVRSLDLSEWNSNDFEVGQLNIVNQGQHDSELMHNLIALSYKQTMDTYMSMCRDFLVFLAVIDRLGTKSGVDPHFAQDISSVYIPKVVYYLRVYYSLHWIAELEVIPPPSNAIEANLKQLAALEISDGNQEKLTDDPSSTTVLMLYLTKTGSSNLSNLYQGSLLVSIGTLINQSVSYMAHKLWPSDSNLVLTDFLLANYQYLYLQEYCKMIDPWCEGSSAYRQFLCGQSYLFLGEYHKALDCFLVAAQAIDVNDAIMQNLLQADCSTNENLAVLFYVKVMRLFEQFDVPDMVITVAYKAVSTATPGDPNIPNLWSNIFKQHLHLGHNDEAYAALCSNPDLSRKRDCLHRFMVVLCERGQVQELCEYPYTNLQEEFVDIMESHARTIDITTHQYYDVLYAFHIFRGNYRKAGSIMYEYGGRLERELPGKNGLQKQAKCYLAAINALQLVDPKNAWIVTPWDRATKKKTQESPNSSPKRKQEDVDIWYGTDRKKRHFRKLTVYELKDLEKDYLLVLARLQLLRLDADPSHGTGPPLTPDETMTLLIQAGMFDTAFTLASSFNLPKDTIFEGIAAKCVRQSYDIGLTSSGTMASRESWEWLLQNDTGNNNLSQAKRAGDQAWNLLQSYLEKLTNTSNCHAYYRCVVSKLLTMGAPLPTWLYNQYKRVNPADLLYLLVTYDQLQDAADCAIEYINAVLGEGKEYFGLKTSLQATSPSVWLPYTTLDHLLTALQTASPKSNLSKMHDKLLDRLEKYHEQVKRVSDDMITTAWKRFQRRNMAAESIHGNR